MQTVSSKIVHFASLGAVLTDSLVRIVRFRFQIVSPGTSETVPGLAELRNRRSLKGFLYKMLFCGALSFSRNLAFPFQVSLDGPRSFILLTVSCVLLVSALLLLTVSSESSSFASGIVYFADSLVSFASPGAASADSLVRIAFRCICLSVCLPKA